MAAEPLSQSERWRQPERGMDRAARTDAMQRDARRRAELGDFLRQRRQRLAPTDVGLPTTIRRRTPGLRREEVAVLAGVSGAWYTYLEQGRDIHVSREVFESIARALRLAPEERRHLFALADVAPQLEGQPAPEEVSAVYRQLLDQLGRVGSAAYITGWRFDVLAWNAVMVALFGDFTQQPGRDRNLLWLLFTDAAFRSRFADPDSAAEEVLETFRSNTTAHLQDPALPGFVERLREASPAFRRAWARHNVRGKGCPEARTLQHPLVGALTLNVAGFQLVNDPEQRMCVYSAAPGSEAADKLQALRLATGNARDLERA